MKKPTIFDFLSGITDKKIPWEEWSETDVKTMSPYMINRWLSMNTDLLEFVNDMQEYTSNLDKREIYKIYFNMLPKMRFFYKYIKKSGVKKYSPDLIEYIVKYFSISEKEAIEYIDIYKLYDNEDIELSNILSKYGIDEKKRKKMLKIIKK